MSYYDYKESQEIAVKDYSFYSLIMAAMRQADDNNTEKLKRAWPWIWEELQKRYNAPRGKLPGEEEEITTEEKKYAHVYKGPSSQSVESEGGVSDYKIKEETS